jgi:hypothetical protein
MGRYSGGFETVVETAGTSATATTKGASRSLSAGAGASTDLFRSTGRVLSNTGRNVVTVLSEGGRRARTAFANFGTPKKAVDNVIEKGIKNADGLDAKTLAKSDDVIEASRTQTTSLAKMGLRGALAVGALMILTENSNPITAIREAAEGAADLGADVGKGLGGLFKGFGEMFAFLGSYGKYVSSASSFILLLIGLSIAMSAVKK